MRLHVGKRLGLVSAGDQGHMRGLHHWASLRDQELLLQLHSKRSCLGCEYFDMYREPALPVILFRWFLYQDASTSTTPTCFAVGLFRYPHLLLSWPRPWAMWSIRIQEVKPERARLSFGVSIPPSSCSSVEACSCAFWDEAPGMPECA